MGCVIASTDTSLLYFYLYIYFLPQHNNFPLIYPSIRPNTCKKRLLVLFDMVEGGGQAVILQRQLIASAWSINED